MATKPVRIPTESVIHHLHECTFGAVGTLSQKVAGFPFVSVLPFVPDEQHRPVFLMSKLAEHTKNALADPRGSFLLFQPKKGDVLAGKRLTMLGEIKPIPIDDDLVARYHRYQPEASEYKALGDFSYFRFEPQTLRLIAGFGQMGWSDATALMAADKLELREEAQLMRELASDQPPHVKILGLDRYGMDVEVSGQRERQKFPDVPLGEALLQKAAHRILQNLHG